MKRVAAALVVLVAVLTLVEYASGADLGIDQLLVTDHGWPHSSRYPGRMAPVTALAFIAAALALALLDLPFRPRTHPAEALATQLLDGGRADHAAIADQHDVAQAELLAQLVGLRQEGGGIGGVAVEHRDRHRAAAAIAQQAPVDLQLALLAVATVAARRQRAAVALEVARRQIVERQAA